METAKCFLEFVRNDRVAKKIIYGMVRGAPFVIESCEILSGDFSVIIGGEAPKHGVRSRKLIHSVVGSRSKNPGLKNLSGCGERHLSSLF